MNMEDNASEWQLDITVNDQSISQVPFLEFEDLPTPDQFDGSTLPEPSPSNSFTVGFGQPVRLRRLDVSAPSGSTLPTEMTIVPLQPNGEPFTSDTGDVVVVPLRNGMFELPEDFPTVTDEITFLIVGSDQPSPSISTEFLGCLHIGKNLAMNVRLWFHQILPVFGGNYVISANAFLYPLKIQD